MKISGASASEVAQIEELVTLSSKSPSARRLFADLAQTGLSVLVKDDALDPLFTAEPETMAYSKAGIVYLRRSMLANDAAGGRLLNAFLHESIHAADTLNMARVNPIHAQITAQLGANPDPRQLDAELSAMMEARGYAGADNIMNELGLAPGKSGGFGLTGERLGQIAADIAKSPGYSNGITQVFAASLSDAVLGHALLG